MSARRQVSRETPIGGSPRATHLNNHHPKREDIPLLAHGISSQDLRCRPRCCVSPGVVLRAGNRELPPDDGCQPEASESRVAALVDQNVCLRVRVDEH